MFVLGGWALGGRKTGFDRTGGDGSTQRSIYWLPPSLRLNRLKRWLVMTEWLTERKKKNATKNFEVNLCLFLAVPSFLQIYMEQIYKYIFYLIHLAKTSLPMIGLKQMLVGRKPRHSCASHSLAMKEGGRVEESEQAHPGSWLDWIFFPYWPQPRFTRVRVTKAVEAKVDRAMRRPSVAKQFFLTLFCFF